MTGSTLIVLATAATLLLPGAASAQARQYPLESVDGLRLLNVAAEPAMLQGKKGLRLTLAEETARRLERMSPSERAQAEIEQLAWIEGLDFSSGLIEAEIAGTPGPGANEGARGFVGIAFRLQEDRKTYDAFYLRPTNGRAEDQERRNHSAQYISHPERRPQGNENRQIDRMWRPDEHRCPVRLTPVPARARRNACKTLARPWVFYSDHT